MSGKFWKFIGLPPLTSPVTMKDLPLPLTATERVPEQTTLPLEELPVVTTHPWDDWKGARLADGTPFHDLSGVVGGDVENGKETRQVRHVSLDDSHRLPLTGMKASLLKGDVLLVSLRELMHMDAQQKATHRTIQQLGGEIGVETFLLDDAGLLLLMVGVGVRIDPHHHQLGIPLEPLSGWNG